MLERDGETLLKLPDEYFNKEDEEMVNRWDEERQPLNEYKVEDMVGSAIGSDFLTYVQKTLAGLDRKRREGIQKDIKLCIKAQEADIEKKPKD